MTPVLFIKQKVVYDCTRMENPRRPALRSPWGIGVAGFDLGNRFCFGCDCHHDGRARP